MSQRHTLARAVIDIVLSRTSLVVANLLLLATASRILMPTDYAAFRQAFLPYELLGPILALGLPSALHYVLPRYRNRANANLDAMALTVAPIVLLAVLSWLGLGSLYVSAIDNPNVGRVINWLPVYWLLQGLVQVYSSVLIFEKKTRVVGISTLASTLLLLTGLVLSLNASDPLVALTHVRVGSAALLGLLLAVASLHTLGWAGMEFEGIGQRFRSLLSVSVPLGVAGAVSGLAFAIDKTVVAILGSPRDYAIFVNGAIEIPLIGIVAGSISAVIVGEMSRKVAVNDLLGAALVFRDAATESAKVLFPVMVFCLLFSEEIVITLFSSVYTESATIFSIYLLLIPIRIVVFGSALVALGKSSFLLRRACIEVGVNIVLSVPLWYAFGMIGVACATIISAYVWAVPASVSEISRSFAISPFRLLDLNGLMRVLGVSALPIPIYVALKIFVDRPTWSLLMGAIPLVILMALTSRGRVTATRANE